MQTDLAFPQSLAEKYRPARIADFIGLDRPKKVLTAFCKRSTSGAWLFVGPSGVGESTMALPLANELQAELHKVPSQKCTAAAIEDVVRQCWYAPMTPGGFHIVLADEAEVIFGVPIAELFAGTGQRVLKRVEKRRSELKARLQRRRAMMKQLPFTATVCREFQLLPEESECTREIWHEGCAEICRLRLVGKESGDDLLRLQAKYARVCMLLRKHVSSCPLCQPASRIA
jgi:DNA polymerase III delta prime subunit